MSLIASALDEGAVQVSKSKTIWSRTVYLLVLKNFITLLRQGNSFSVICCSADFFYCCLSFVR